MDEEDLPFEEAIFLYFQSLNPEQKLNRNEIDYIEVREIIEQFVLSNKCNLINSSLNVLSQTSEAIENNFIHFEFFPDFFNNNKKNLFLNNDKKIDRRTLKNKKFQKFQEKKREFVSFNCDESELTNVFKNSFNDILKNRTSSVNCCKVIINSLAMFFAHNTWSNCVQDNVINFLHKNVLLSSAKMCQEIHINKLLPEKMVLKIQVMCLLELFCAKFLEFSINETNIIEKLIFLQYLFGEEETKKFINESIQAEFGFLLPLHVSFICETFNVSLIQKRRKLSNGEPYSSFNESKTDENEGKILRNSSFLKQRISTDGIYKFLPTNSQNDDENSSENELLPLVEEEYESLNGKNDSDYASSVSLSPLQKISNRSLSPKKKQYRRIYFSSEDEFIKSPKNLKMAREIAKKNIKLETSKIYSKKIEKKKLPKNAQRVVKLNESLNNRNLKEKITKSERKNNIKTFDDVKVKSKLNKSKPISDIRTPVLATKNQKPHESFLMSSKTLSPNSINNSSSLSNKSLSPILLNDSLYKSSFVLNDSTMAQYKKRMELIRNNARKLKLNLQEVFYGRGNSRVNLFEEIDVSLKSNTKNQLSKSNVTQSDSLNNRRQKNRSGRSINATINNYVNIAHTLLNINNILPLLPYKTRKNSTISSDRSKNHFKIRKLVKPANRTERRRMEKFKRNSF